MYRHNKVVTKSMRHLGVVEGTKSKRRDEAKRLGFGHELGPGMQLCC